MEYDTYHSGRCECVATAWASEPDVFCDMVDACLTEGIFEVFCNYGKHRSYSAAMVVCLLTGANLVHDDEAIWCRCCASFGVPALMRVLRSLAHRGRWISGFTG